MIFGTIVWRNHADHVSLSLKIRLILHHKRKSESTHRVKEFFVWLYDSHPIASFPYDFGIFDKVLSNHKQFSASRHGAVGQRLLGNLNEHINSLLHSLTLQNFLKTNLRTACRLCTQNGTRDCHQDLFRVWDFTSKNEPAFCRSLLRRSKRISFVLQSLKFVFNVNISEKSSNYISGNLDITRIAHLSLRMPTQSTVAVILASGSRSKDMTVVPSIFLKNAQKELLSKSSRLKDYSRRRTLCRVLSIDSACLIKQVRESKMFIMSNKTVNTNRSTDSDQLYGWMRESRPVLDGSSTPCFLAKVTRE